MWLHRQARQYFAERLTALQPRFHALALPEPELAIRSMKTCWGSCTSKGKITLNLYLMRATEPCISYVIVHELCHLLEHNHGKGFYVLVDKMMPDWRARRTRLNKLGCA